jgi:hypothetical protein
MTERAAKYVSNTTTSYRRGVCSANLPIFYFHEDSPADGSAPLGCTDEEPSLTIMAHTSLFRWVTTLGKNARRQSDTVPVGSSPAPHKYTSEQRRSVLIACRATCSVLLSGHAPAR